MIISSKQQFIGLVYLLAAVAPFAPGNANAEDFTGPTTPRDIAAETLGNVPLGPEYPDIAGFNGRELRMRLWTIQPGGIVPLHSHRDRPAIMYILDGDIIEHRDDRDDPVVHSAPGISKESGGVTHWWENTGDVTVQLIAIDIFNADPALNGTPIE